MGDVVGSKTERKHNQRPQSQSDRSQLSPPADVRQPWEDADEVYVAEAANKEGNAEENHAQLQTHRQEDLELSIGESLVADVAGWLYRPGRVVVRHDVDDAEVKDGKHPHEDAGEHGVYGSSPQRVLDRERHAKIALHAHRGQDKGAVVDGHVEDKARQRTQKVVKIPYHIIGHFLHFKGQEDEEEQVWHGEVEKEDVDGSRLPPNLAAERVEGQDIGREAGDEGEDVDGETQMIITDLHGCSVPYSPREKEASVWMF